MNHKQALQTAYNLRLSPNLDAVDSSRAWALWQYINTAPWICYACDGRGFIRHDTTWSERCSRCNGTGDLLPEPIEPEGDS